MSPGAPTALLLHGFGGAGRHWATLRSLLTLPSLAPNLPGFGGSAPLPEPSIAAYAAFVAEEIAAMSRPLVLVGASMGGKIAMAAAAARPDLVEALVLCAPSPPTPEPMAPEDRRDQLSAWRDAEAGERSVREGLANPPEPGVLEALLSDWLSVDAETWRWWWESGSRETLDVSAVRAPTLILGGEADERLGAQAQKRLTLPHLAGARLQAVEGAGHLLALDQPAAVAAAIEAAAGRL